MSRFVAFGIIAAACVVLFGADLWAEDPKLPYTSPGNGAGGNSSDPADKFGRYAEGAKAAVKDSIMPARQAIRWWQEKPEDSTGAAAQWPRTAAQGTTEQGQNTQSQNQLQYPYYLPSAMAGFQSILREETYAKMVADGIKDPLVIMNTTWHLTEPGFAAGMNAATSQASQFLGSRYSAEQSLYQQFMLDPKWGKETRDSYVNCIAESQEKTWEKAQAICFREKVELREASGGAAVQATPAYSGNPSTSFRSGTDPFASQQQGGQDAPILLTDRLFGPKSSEASGQQQNPDRDSFLNLIGDLEIKYGQEQNGQAATSYRLTINVKRVPPRQKADQVYWELVEDKWNRIFGVLLKKCQNANQSLTASGYQPFQPATYNYWEKIPIEEIMPLSALGYTAKPITFDVLYTLKIAKKAAGGGGSDSGQECDRLFGTTNNNLQELLSANGTISEDKNADPAQLAVYFIARKLAAARMYAIFLEALRTVRTLVGTAFDDTVANQAADLIFEAAGTPDVADTYKRNIDELRTYIDALQTVAASQSGESGAAAAGIFATGVHMKSMTAGTQHVNAGSN